MFGRNIGAALAAVTDPVLRQGLKEAILRTAVQIVAYVSAFSWLIYKLRTT
jgi:hypothetical protein